MTERNWAGNYAYRAHTIHRPGSVAELQAIAGRAERLRVLGSRHSFTSIADAPELVTLDGLPGDVTFEDAVVWAPGTMRYGELAAVLAERGLALANLASLPHISVAGAVATATHGSGDGNGNLATSVAGLELVTSEGELVSFTRGDPDFDGVVVGLGALGAVTQVALDVEPDYAVRQRVFEALSWDALHAHYDEITRTGYSVSLFTLWGGDAGDVWVKSRVDDAPEEVRDELFGARAATVEHHPIPGLDPVHCSAQRGVPGPWWDRIPHFRMGFTPSNGDELQSEYLLPRSQALAAVDVLRGLADRIRPMLQVSEIRTVAADGLWLSPQYRSDTVGVHFTWRPDEAGVRAVLVGIEAALEPFAPRPHWGKLFLANAETIATRYERLDDFRRLADRLDPRGAFRNAWLEEHVL